jgi:crotonobetaine/carnitine-CoA ligase
MADFLYRQPPRPDDADTPLRRIQMAPVIREAEEFKRRFGLELCVGLGQTEAAAPIVAPYGTTIPGACGWPRPDFEVRLVDEHDREVEPGAVGELILRPTEPWSVMLEYHRQPEATREKWRNLWLHTGDLLRQGEEGQFFFVDRNNDAIRRRGENISSYEVEMEIRSHAEVAEVAVIGVPSEHYEYEVKACVRLVPGAAVEAAALHDHLRERLPYFMVPRYIEFVEEFEKTSTERINKAVLRERSLTADTWDAQAHGLEARRND